MKCVVALLLVWSTGALAEASPRDELAAACTRDAMSICSWHALQGGAAGNYAEIDACFKAHRERLSGNCRAALARYGSGR